MKKIIFPFFMIISLFGITKNDIYKLYNQKNYKLTCIKGTWLVKNYKTDDEYLSVVALSCLKIDMLNTAMRISKVMNNSAMGRENASYIASLYLIKKLLLQLIWDKIDISNLSLPKADHFLSVIFENIAHNNFSKVDNSYVVKHDNKRYVLSPLKPNKIKISIYKNNKLLSTHIYW